MITSRAVLFGFIGGCFYLIAVVNALPPLFLALMWLTAGIVLSCFGLAVLSLHGLSAGWKLEAGGVAQAASPLQAAVARDDEGNEIAPRPQHDEAAGAEVGLALEVGNVGTFAKSDIVIEVHLRALKPPQPPQQNSSHPGQAAERVEVPAPRGRGQGRGQGRGRGSRGEGGEVIVRRFLIEALPSRAQLHTFLPLHDLERGRYSVILVRVIGSDVLGLFRPRKKIALEISGASSASPFEAGADGPRGGEAGTVIVGPRVVRLGGRHASVSAGSGGRSSGTASLAGRSDEFGGTRPYVAGDDLRFVHWKSTARRGEMVVREWERASLHRSLVLWDGACFPFLASGSLSSVRSGAQGNGRSAMDAASSGAGPGVGQVMLQVLGRVLFVPRVLAARAARLRLGGGAEAWRLGVEWSLEVSLSLASALAESGEPCTLCRLDASPARAEVPNVASLARGAELLADAQAARTVPLQESLRAVMGPGRTRDLEGRAFVVALWPSPSLLATARRLRQCTVVLIDVSRLHTERSDRAHQAAWRGWRQALDEGEAQLREAGLRVLRLPLEDEGARQNPREEPGEAEADKQTREALRALLDERSAASFAAASSGEKMSRT